MGSFTDYVKNYVDAVKLGIEIKKLLILKAESDLNLNCDDVKYVMYVYLKKSIPLDEKILNLFNETLKNAVEVEKRCLSK